MLATAANPRAVIGDNGAPPEPTPYEQAEKTMLALYDEAKLWLDGKPVENQAQADDLANLLSMFRAAEKRAEEARKIEKAPHLEAAKAVDTKFRPILDMATRAAEGIKSVLAPWLRKVDEEHRAAAEKARAEAEEKQHAAQEAIRAADPANLAEREAAEKLIEDAQRAGKGATRASKAKASSGGAIGRAIGLRTVYSARLVDERAAGAHYWKEARGELLALFQGLADRDVRNGKRVIPGFEIDETKVPV